MKKKHLLNVFIIFSIIGFGLPSCNLSGVDQEIDDTDTSRIVANNNVEEKNSMMLSDSINGQPNDLVFQRDDGLRIEWTTKKNTKQIQLNDVVMVNYTARVAAGEVYDSNKELGKPVPLKTNIGMMVKGWQDGLLQMHEGDEGRIMIPSALGYGENGYLTIVPPDADLIIDIEIVEIIDPIVLDEGVKVYKWQKGGTGELPKKNQLISFDYFAYTMGKNGHLYDNSYQNGEPFSFKFKNANVVDGLHQGMCVLKAGENAFIEIPSKLAYGKEGIVDLVPKNADIVYDVRVLSIQ